MIRSNYSFDTNILELNETFGSQYRITLIGDKGVGKTSLAAKFSKSGKALVSDPVVNFFHRTIETDVLTGYNARLIICDLSTDDEYRNLVKTFYRNSAAFLLVFDITDRRTFAGLQKWYQECRVHVLPNDPMIVVVGNMADMTDQRDVLVKDAAKYAYERDLRYYETSAASGHNVKYVFSQIAKALNAKADNETLVESFGNRAFMRATNPSVDNLLAKQSNRVMNVKKQTTLLPS